MIPEYDVTGTEFVDGATEAAMSHCGISDEDAREALLEISESLFRRCKKWRMVDVHKTTQFPSGKTSTKNFINGTQVVVDPILPEGPIQRIRIYDKNGQLVGLMKVRES